MTKVSEQQRIGEILRRQGVTQQSRVEALVSEVRSDFVPIFPPPIPPQPNGILGGVVVIWQFCLTPDEVADFHEFLRNNEDFIGTATVKSVKGAYYRGTYMVLVGGEECCRPTAVPAEETATSTSRLPRCLTGFSGNSEHSIKNDQALGNRSAKLRASIGKAERHTTA